MKELIIDTATDQGIVALAQKGELLEEKLLPKGIVNSKVLFPTLFDLLKMHDVSPQELTMIACGVGPGSYTGMRVGAAFAQALAFAHKIPLVSFSSLIGFLPPKDGTFAILLDAKIGGAYFLVAEKENGEIQILSGPAVAPLEKLPMTLEGFDHIVSVSGESFQNKVKPFLTSNKWEEGSPSGKLLAAYCYQKHLQGAHGPLQLLYLREAVS